MQDLILKTFRWYVVMAFIIAGLGCLHLADTADIIKPVFPGIISLGAAFVFGTAWKDLRRKTLFMAIVIGVSLAFVSQFGDDLLYLVSGNESQINFFIMWAALSLIIGFPAMMYVFHKYGD